MIALIIYAANQKLFKSPLTSASFGYSFIVGWVAVAMGLTASVIAWTDLGRK